VVLELIEGVKKQIGIVRKYQVCIKIGERGRWNGEN
jgi:hypothetical protein